jgi:hypothetical protein
MLKRAEETKATGNSMMTKGQWHDDKSMGTGMYECGFVTIMQYWT